MGRGENIAVFVLIVARLLDLSSEIVVWLRHPATGQPYYDVAAFNVLQQQRRQLEQQQLQGGLYSSPGFHAGAVGEPASLLVCILDS